MSSVSSPHTGSRARGDNAASIYSASAIPRPKRGWTSFTLALIMHGALFVFLFFGIHWQIQQPAPVIAELWSALPQTQAPASAIVPAVPEFVPAKVKIAAPQPRPEIKADIALKAELPKQQAKRLLPQEAPKPVEKIKPHEAKALPQPSAQAPSYLNDLLAQADASARLNAPGSARHNSAPGIEDAYKASIRNKILSNLSFPVPNDGINYSEAVFAIQQLPSGEIVQTSKKKSSNLPGYDNAVERAIMASSPLPKKSDGKVEPVLELVFKPRDKR